jgi:ABC-2 type transport system ATP-binding protein
LWDRFAIYKANGIFGLSLILKISNLKKRYGVLTAVDGLSLDIESGQVYGLLGPNGSGKTTTLGMIMGTILPTSGEFRWFSSESLEKALLKVGSIIETPAFYPYLSGKQNLSIISDIKGSPKGELNEILAQVGLGERMNDPYRNYSLGMKQRLALAGAMIASPAVMVLDEPTNGMDPQGIADIRDLIRKIASNGTTIILASHLLDEVQKICTHVAVLDRGKSIFNGSVHDILASDDHIEIAADDMEILERELREFKGIIKIEKEEGSFVIQLSAGPTKKDLQKFLIQRNIYPNHLANRQGSLEKKFPELLKSNQ